MTGADSWRRRWPERWPPGRPAPSRHALDLACLEPHRRLAVSVSAGLPAHTSANVATLTACEWGCPLRSCASLRRSTTAIRTSRSATGPTAPNLRTDADAASPSTTIRLSTAPGRGCHPPGHVVAPPLVLLAPAGPDRGRDLGVQPRNVRCHGSSEEEADGQGAAPARNRDEPSADGSRPPADRTTVATATKPTPARPAPARGASRSPRRSAPAGRLPATTRTPGGCTRQDRATGGERRGDGCATCR